MNRPAKIRTTIIVSLSLILLISLSGCGEKNPKIIFRCDGGWYMPPAFNGNPYAPGGDGTHMHFIWNRLFLYVPATGEYIPRLALSFEFSPDRRKLTIKLRRDVQWHDGTPFTARDVKTTFLLKYANGWGEPLRIIEIPDDYTVVFKWREPFGTIDEKIIFNDRVMAPDHIFGKFSRNCEQLILQAQNIPLDLEGQHVKYRESKDRLFEKKAEQWQEVLQFRPETPIGTGPFKFAFVSASDLGMTRFEEFWDGEKITVDEIRLLKGVSNDLIWAYLISGEIDGTHPSTTQDVTEQILKLNPGTKLILAPEYGDIGFMFNTTKEPFSDLAFRRAVAHAINKDDTRMISYYYSTTSGVHNTGVFQTLADRYLDPAVVEKMTPYEYDVLKARTLLDQAGYTKDKDGFYMTPGGQLIQIEIASIAGFSDWVLACESLSNQLEILGVRSKIRTYEVSLFHQLLNANQYDMAVNFGTDYRAYAHPAPSFDRMFGKSGYIKVSSGLPDRLKNMHGEEVDVTRGVRELYRIHNEKKLREQVGELAWMANEYLPFISIYDKNLMVFVTEGSRVYGWPAENDPIWTACSAGLESVFSYLISTGRVKGVPR